jgi:hypothetical protein
MRKLVAMVVFAVLGVADLCGQTSALRPSEAKDHIGQRATVCGKVVSGHYAEKSKGQPTFLNLDEPYPKQIFTVVIWGADRKKFGTPERKYEKSRVCVTGKITSYRSGPEVIATNPNQLAIEK